MSSLIPSSAYRARMVKVVSVSRETRGPRDRYRSHGEREGIRVVMQLECGHSLVRDFMWVIRRDWGNGGLTRGRAEDWEKRTEVPCVACGPTVPDGG